jgi:hypothetical protein
MPTYLTDQDLQNYGTDLVDFAQRAAAHALTPQLEHMQAQNAKLQAQLIREAKHRIDMALDQAVPNWREINSDPRFIDWLRRSDPLSGQPRQALLDEATTTGNAARVISFFRGFLNESWGAGRGGAQRPAAGDKPTYTRAQIAWFYNQHRRGAYKGREAEWARQEADFYAAQREGRVIGGLPADGTK